MFGIMYRHIIDIIEENTDISRDIIIECLMILLEKGYSEISAARMIISEWNNIIGGNI